MRSELQLCLTLCAIFCCVTTAQAANTTSSSSKTSTTCDCSGLSCKCCQNLKAGPLPIGKSLCLQFKLIIKPLKLNVLISLDNTTLVEFSVDPMKPPTACIPIILPMNVAMCVRLHDMKLVGLTALQVCASLHLNFIKDQVLSYKLPCAKLGAKGIDLMT